MQHWMPPMPTLPGGVFVRGVSRRGMLIRSGMPVMYGSPGVKPMKYTRYSAPAWSFVLCGVLGGGPACVPVHVDLLPELEGDCETARRQEPQRARSPTARSSARR